MIVCKTVLQCAVSAILPQIAKMNSERGVCGCVYEGACVCVCLVSLLLDSQFFAILCVFFSSGFLFDENFINCDSEVRSHKPTPPYPAPTTFWHPLFAIPTKLKLLKRAQCLIFPFYTVRIEGQWVRWVRQVWGAIYQIYQLYINIFICFTFTYIFEYLFSYLNPHDTLQETFLEPFRVCLDLLALLLTQIYRIFLVHAFSRIIYIFFLEKILDLFLHI